MRAVHNDGAEDRQLGGWADDWVDRMTFIFHQFGNTGSVRCFLGHREASRPRLTLLMQNSDGEAFGEHVFLGGDPESSMGYPCVRDGVEGLSLLGLFLERIDRSIVLEHGETVGRAHKHPVFELPYHAFADIVPRRSGTRIPTAPGIQVARWVERHSAAIERLGPIETIQCRLSATRKDGHEVYRCAFTTDAGHHYAVELFATGRRRLASTLAEARSASDALALLSQLLRTVRLQATLVPRASE